MAQFPLIQRVAKYITIFNSRADYKAKTGKEAPEFDFTRPRQDWIDNRELEPETETVYTSLRLDANGKPFADQLTGVCELRKFALYPEAAKSVNLLPEPVPAAASLNAVQLAMMARRNPWPLELLPGERVVMANNTFGDVVVDDGKPNLTAGGPGFTEADRQLLHDIANAVKGGAR